MDFRLESKQGQPLSDHPNIGQGLRHHEHPKHRHLLCEEGNGDVAGEGDGHRDADAGHPRHAEKDHLQNPKNQEGDIPKQRESQVFFPVEPMVPREEADHDAERGASINQDQHP